MQVSFQSLSTENNFFTFGIWFILATVFLNMWQQRNILAVMFTVFVRVYAVYVHSVFLCLQMPVYERGKAEQESRIWQ